MSAARFIDEVNNAGVVPRVLYDLGIGYKTEYREIAEAFPGISVYGVNAVQEDLDRVSPHPSISSLILRQVAVGAFETRGVINKVLGNGWSSLLPLPAKYRPTTVPVQIVTLDSLDREWGTPDDILLWADIEGSELGALGGAPNLLASGRVKLINLEATADNPYDRHRNAWPKAGNLDRLLREYGYTRVASYGVHRNSLDLVYRLEGL